MLSNLIFVLNGVVPIFILIALGYFLKRRSFVSDEFVKVADKLVFKLLLPAYLFNSVSGMNRDDFVTDDAKVVIFALLLVALVAFGSLFISGFFIKDKAKKGAFVQGIFRSNAAILGIPFAQNLFGDSGARIAALLLAFVVPLYNVLAVIIFCVCDPDISSSQPLGKKIKDVLLGIVKNPLIISIFLGLIVCFSGITLPTFLTNTVSYLSGASTPLALIAIGANFSFGDLKGRAALAFVSASIKTIFLPCAAIGLAMLMGFEGSYLGALFIAFGTPVAISSYIMAKNMNSDYRLASQIIIATTLLSAITIPLGSFILFSTGLVPR